MSDSNQESLRIRNEEIRARVLATQSAEKAAHEKKMRDLRIEQARRDAEENNQRERDRNAAASIPVAVDKTVQTQPERKKSGGGFFWLLVIGIGIAVAVNHSDKQKREAVLNPDSQTHANTPKPVDELPPQSPAQPFGGSGVSEPDTTPLPTPERTSANNTTLAAEPEQAAAGGGDDLPFFMTREVVESDIEGKSAEDLSLMRLEVFARHGAEFPETNLQFHFNSLPWYHPKGITAIGVLPSLSALEHKNVEFFYNAEKQLR